LVFYLSLDLSKTFVVVLMNHIFLQSEGNNKYSVATTNLFRHLVDEPTPRVIPVLEILLVKRQKVGKVVIWSTSDGIKD
jgi:hypothetical protein